MFIKTKKRGEIEVGGDEELAKALSKTFGKILDEMYDLIIKETTLTMWIDEDLTVCVNTGGDSGADEDFKTMTLERLIGDAAQGANKQEIAMIKDKLIKIAESL